MGICGDPQVFCLLSVFLVFGIACGYIVGLFTETNDGSSCLSASTSSSSSGAAHSAPGTITAVEIDGAVSSRSVSLENYISESDTKPNVFVILVDDLGMSDISATGAEYSTPHIDRLFNEGIFYNRVYGMPLCTPSRAAMMTGRLSYKMGLQFHEVLHIQNTAAVPTTEKILGEYLQDAGYSTHYFGRWALGHATESARPLSRGYDSFNGFLTLLNDGYDSIVAGMIPDLYWVMDWWNDKEADNPKASYNDIYSYQKLMEKLDEINNAPGDNPWHIMWSTQTIHTDQNLALPPILPKLYAQCESTLRPTFCYRMVYLDMLIGDIFDSIENYGWWDNTMIVFTTDNGGEQLWINTEGGLETEELYSSNQPFRGSKGSYNEGGIRCVTAIGGGWVPQDYRGTTNTDRHHLMDITPTILDVAKLEIDNRDHLDGNNMMFEDHNDQLIININSLAVISWLDWDPVANGICIFFGDWKYLSISYDYYLESHGSATSALTGLVYLGDRESYDSVRDRFYGFDETYFECWSEPASDSIFASKGCLYNIAEDPTEQNNVWDDHPDVIEMIQGIISEEYFGTEYKPGQNMEQDPRASLLNQAKADPVFTWGDDLPQSYDDYPTTWIGAWIPYPGDSATPLNDYDIGDENNRPSGS